MALFFKLLHLFGENKPHKEFENLYSILNKLAGEIKKEAILLRKIQKEIVEGYIARKKFGVTGATGGVSLSKTEMIEEELTPKLKSLAAKTEKRYLEVEGKTKQKEPFPLEEERELKAVIDFLEKVKNLIIIENLGKLSTKDKLRIIEAKLREIEELSKEFYKTRKSAGAIIRKVEKHEINPLLWKVFNKAKQSNNFTAFATKDELRQIYIESEKINSCRDPNWRIIWRKWYQEPPKLEIDLTTPIKEPHVNVTMILNGEKKAIHLCERA